MPEALHTLTLANTVARSGRIVIAGGPGVGKSTLSRRIAKIMGLDPLAVKHTDDLVGVLDWSAASSEAATWMVGSGPWIVEGVASIRACRKVLAVTTVAPCDVLLFLTFPFIQLSKGQAAMAKGCQTILSGIVDDLRKRGVEVAIGRAPELP